jgi:hypothetical protein
VLCWIFGVVGARACLKIVASSVVVTSLATTTRLGGVIMLQDNNKIKTIENIGIKLNDQSKWKQLPLFNLNQTSITKL